MIELSRLMLDNFAHIKVRRVMLMPPIAQTARCPTARLLLPHKDLVHLVHLIRAAGYEPVLRDRTYSLLWLRAPRLQDASDPGLRSWGIVQG